MRCSVQRRIFESRALEISHLLECGRSIHRKRKKYTLFKYRNLKFSVDEILEIELGVFVVKNVFLLIQTLEQLHICYNIYIKK